MAVAAPGRLNLDESPSWGSRSVDCFEKLEQIGEGTYGISAKDALDAEYFWTDPLPCDPKSLPNYESSHEFQTKKKRQQQRQHEEMAKRQKLQHGPPHRRLPPIQTQLGQQHMQIRPGPNQPVHNAPSQVVAGPSHHYNKPCRDLPEGRTDTFQVETQAAGTIPTVAAKPVATVVGLIHLKEEDRLVMLELACLEVVAMELVLQITSSKLLMVIKVLVEGLT